MRGEQARRLYAEVAAHDTTRAYAYKIDVDAPAISIFCCRRFSVFRAADFTLILR